MATQLPLPLPGDPPGVFPHFGGLGDPLSVSHFRGLACQVFPPAGDPLLFPFFRPMAAPAPTVSASTAVTSGVAPSPAAAPHGPVSMPLPSIPSAVGFGFIPISPAPPAVSIPPSDTNSSVSSLLHSVLLAVISSLSVPPTGYFLPASASCLPPVRYSVSPPSVSLMTKLSLLPPSSPLPPPPCCASLPFHPWVSPLVPYPHLRHPLGSCIQPRCPSHLLPWPWLSIFSVRTKISATGQAGVRHTGLLWAYPRRAVRTQAAPPLWWATASSGPCYYTVPNSSTQCTVDSRCGTRTPWRTSPWWSRLSVRCNCITAQLA